MPWAQFCFAKVSLVDFGCCLWLHNYILFLSSLLHHAPYQQQRVCEIHLKIGDS